MTSRFHLYFPIKAVEDLPSKTFVLPRPAGFLSIDIIAGKNLLAKVSSVYLALLNCVPDHAWPLLIGNLD